MLGKDIQVGVACKGGDYVDGSNRNAHPRRYDLSAQHDQHIKVKVYTMLWIVQLWE